jgi:hypothetical protein
MEHQSRKRRFETICQTKSVEIDPSILLLNKRLTNMEKKLENIISRMNTLEKEVNLKEIESKLDEKIHEILQKLNDSCYSIESKFSDMKLKECSYIN